MRRFLANTFVLALLAVAFAGPPIDYELICGEDGDLVGILSLTEGKVRVALAEDVGCAPDDVMVVVPHGAPEVVVKIDWDVELPITVSIAGVDIDDVDLVVVPLVALDGMEIARRLRAAAMEMRREAAERGETDRDRIAWDDEDPPGNGEPGGPPDGVPNGPPTDVPPGNAPGGPPTDVPPGGPPTDVPPPDGVPNGPPTDVPPGNAPGGPPTDVPPPGNGAGRRP